MTAEFLFSLLIIATVFIVGEQVILRVARLLGVYVIQLECEARVYVLFGNVVGTLTEPGLHLLWPKFGWKALLVNWLGKVYLRDLRVDQLYLRSTAVNSEEGAPMGIGVWYEMTIKDPIAHVFRNTDPRGSLAASVSNATVKCLSNMKLEEMLESRHKMSRLVRDEVTEQSMGWGYSIGSVYIRKVHFRDHMMIKQIEEKVVNRLRQVTSAIRQEGNNQVNIIASTADAQSSIEFAKAAARRPEIVGKALDEISKDREVASALFEVLETNNLVESNAEIILVRSSESGSGMLTQLMASGVTH
jgi:regulator of protease activity HflC (stomatin/prohibitin superfamily)